jgi:nitrous oxidase accessory protein NosD
MRERERERERVTETETKGKEIVLWDSHNKRIDTTTLKDFSFGIFECTRTGFIIITNSNKENLENRLN